MSPLMVQIWLTLMFIKPIINEEISCRNICVISRDSIVISSTEMCGRGDTVYGNDTYQVGQGGFKKCVNIKLNGILHLQDWTTKEFTHFVATGKFNVNCAGLNRNNAPSCEHAPWDPSNNVDGRKQKSFRG